MSLTLHRVDRELRGKQLSANTIASFLAAQRVRSVPSLNVDVAMEWSLLHFLNRDRAMGYWVSQGWLRRNGDGVYLTPEGLDEVQSREAGVALRHDGRKKSGNVTPMLVAAALRVIESGECDKNDSVQSRIFDRASTLGAYT